MWLSMTEYDHFHFYSIFKLFQIAASANRSFIHMSTLVNVYVDLVVFTRIAGTS